MHDLQKEIIARLNTPGSARIPISGGTDAIRNRITVSAPQVQQATVMYDFNLGVQKPKPDNRSNYSLMDAKAPNGGMPNYMAHNVNRLNVETQVLNAVTGNDNAKKRYNKMLDDAYLKEILHGKQAQLGTKWITPLTFGPLQVQEPNLENVPPILLNLAEFMAQYLNWPILPTLMPLLGGINVAMCGRYRLRPREDWISASQLYLFICAFSGIKKSALVELVKETFDIFIKERSREYHERNPHDFNKNLILSKVVKKIISSHSQNLAVGHIGGKQESQHLLLEGIDVVAGDIAELEKYIAALPSLPDFLFDGVTFKKLAALMASQGEFMAFIGSEDYR